MGPRHSFKVDEVEILACGRTRVNRELLEIWFLSLIMEYSKNHLVLLWNPKKDSRIALSSRLTADPETFRICAPKNPPTPTREIRPALGPTARITGSPTTTAPPPRIPSPSSSSAADQAKCLILSALQARSQSSPEEMLATEPRATLQGHWLGGKGGTAAVAAPLSAPYSRLAPTSGANYEVTTSSPVSALSSPTSMVILNPPVTQCRMLTPNYVPSIAATRRLSLDLHRNIHFTARPIRGKRDARRTQKFTKLCEKKTHLGHANAVQNLSYNQLTAEQEPRSPLKTSAADQHAQRKSQLNGGAFLAEILRTIEGAFYDSFKLHFTNATYRRSGQEIQADNEDTMKRLFGVARWEEGKSYSASAFGVQTSCLTVFQQRFNEIMQDVVRFAKKIPGFAELPAEDRVALVQSGCFEVACLVFSFYVNEQTKTLHFPTQFVLEQTQLWFTFPMGRKFINLLFDFCIQLQRFSLDSMVLGHLSAVILVSPVKQGSVLAPTLFDPMFAAMLMDAYRDEQPGIRIAYRTERAPSQQSAYAGFNAPVYD
ncbi:unnamed protein product [Schistocephalus solidus]|uniref:NR LBD domain-containing protein n=1 Tax=Schistocephalus solidus TaxID=70667 RepID=A0A183T150_SCHSO|nr:unnamed protein product [Schistocephalus solidus]